MTTYIRFKLIFKFLCFENVIFSFKINFFLNRSPESKDLPQNYLEQFIVDIIYHLYNNNNLSERIHKGDQQICVDLNSEI